VTLVQAALTEILDQPSRLRPDGRWGPRTEAALAAAMDTLELTGTVDDLAVWRRFLRRSARLGFQLAVPDR
jgi:hypothetical protein